MAFFDNVLLELTGPKPCTDQAVYSAVPRACERVPIVFGSRQLMLMAGVEVTFFDVPLHYNFHEASKAGSRYDLRRILDRTILKFRPGDAVVFVDNHE